MSIPDPLTPEWVAARLAAAVDATPAVPGDDPDPARSKGRSTPAAVLVPLVSRPGGLTVLLTQRTDHLADHAGQISFPGGRAEAHDADAEATALREAEEEIGLPPGLVRILGRLPDYRTVTGFRVTPVVGHIEPPFPIQADAFEVAEVFEVPLAFLMDPGNHQRHTYVREGQSRRYYAMPYQGRYIWGATAGMILNLYEVLRG